MASSKFCVILAALFLLLLAINIAATADDPAIAPYQPEPTVKAVDVVVEGVVHCQSCDDHGTWDLANAKPIEDAIASVICKDHRNRVSYYKTCKTDKNGYFYAQLKDFKMGHYFLDHPLQACKVRLVSSPLKTCNLFTNVNYGLYGAPLRYENKMVSGDKYGALVYAAGPLAFRPLQCTPKEETGEVAYQLPQN